VCVHRHDHYMGSVGHVLSNFRDVFGPLQLLHLAVVFVHTVGKL